MFVLIIIASGTNCLVIWNSVSKTHTDGRHFVFWIGVGKGKLLLCDSFFLEIFKTFTVIRTFLIESKTGSINIQSCLIQILAYPYYVDVELEVEFIPL